MTYFSLRKTMLYIYYKLSLVEFELSRVELSIVEFELSRVELSWVELGQTGCLGWGVFESH